ncbi:MAG: YbaB/EbfC family nucleoid-associated protein [Alphaproteobacteria bacterium]|nr:YbaB/EbfC family nucleoid-associated protein [Alphaproteobacteria bacterium]
MQNLGQLMQKAQQVQTQMNVLQSKMEKLEFTGESGGGAVKITMTGKGVATKVAIDAAVLSDRETLEDLVLVAINNAKDQSEATMAAEMERIQKSLGLPPGFKMPF